MNDTTFDKVVEILLNTFPDAVTVIGDEVFIPDNIQQHFDNLYDLFNVNLN